MYYMTMSRKKQSTTSSTNDEKVFWEQAEKTLRWKCSHYLHGQCLGMAGWLKFFNILGFWGFTVFFETSEEDADFKH